MSLDNWLFGRVGEDMNVFGKVAYVIGATVIVLIVIALMFWPVIVGAWIILWAIGSTMEGIVIAAVILGTLFIGLYVQVFWFIFFIALISMEL